MKKGLLLSLLLVFVLSVLAGCSQPANDGSDADSIDSSAVEVSSVVSEPDSMEDDGSEGSDDVQVPTGNLDINAFKPSDATNVIEAEGAFTCVSNQSLDDLIGFYEAALKEVDAAVGDSATVTMSGLESWSWVGTYAEGASLSISISTNVLGEGYAIAITY